MTAKYKAFVKTLPCCHTGQYGVDAHHIIGVDKMGTMGGKNHDLTCVPLIREVHNQVHADGGKGWPQTRWMIETQQKALEAGVLKL